MAIFKGFKPQGMQKIAGKMGYQGSMENFDNSRISFRWKSR